MFGKYSRKRLVMLYGGSWRANSGLTCPFARPGHPFHLGSQLTPLPAGISPLLFQNRGENLNFY